MSNTTEALKLAEEALSDVGDYDKCIEALAAIREALAEPVKPQKERQDFIDGYTAGMADAKRMQANAEPVNTRSCSEYSEVEYSEPVKQEPVATKTSWGIDLHAGWDKLANDRPRYAAPVHPVKQEPVACDGWSDEVMRQWDYYRSQIANGDKSSEPRDWFESLAPVDAKAIRAEALEEPIGYVIECDDGYKGSIIFAKSSGDDMLPVYLTKSKATMLSDKTKNQIRFENESAIKNHPAYFVGRAEALEEAAKWFEGGDIGDVIAEAIRGLK